MPKPKPVEITDRSRLIHRVAADPGWVQGTEVSPEAFVPRPRDHGRLSASDKGCTADEAYEEWKNRFERSRANKTLSLTVGELNDLGLRVYDDSPDTSQHVHINFNGDEVNIEVLSEILARSCDVGP